MVTRRAHSGRAFGGAARLGSVNLQIRHFSGENARFFADFAGQTCAGSLGGWAVATLPIES
jgi:hypothetical protein